MKKFILSIIIPLFFLLVSPSIIHAEPNLSGSWSGFGYSFKASQTGNSITLIATDGDINGKVSLEGTITGNTVAGRQIMIAKGCPNLEKYVPTKGTISSDGNSITITYTTDKYDPDRCVNISGRESEQTGSYIKVSSPPTATTPLQPIQRPQPTQSPQVRQETPPSVDNKKDQLPVEQNPNLTEKSGGKGSPFNIFGINPYQTWLNLIELAKAGALMGTGAFDRFTESTILHSVGTEPYWERDAREKEAYDRFYNQATERLVKLQGKTGLTEINDSTKKTLIEAAKDPETLKKDSAVIELQPHAGEKGVLETGDKPMLRSGAVDVIVQPQDGQQFKMQTPNAEILVIGTEFSVIYDQKNSETLIAVYKGKVEVKTNDGKVTIITPNGDKPGVVVVAQKLSVAKFALYGLVLTAIIGGTFLFLKRRGINTSASRKKTAYRA